MLPHRLIAVLGTAAVGAVLTGGVALAATKNIVVTGTVHGTYVTAKPSIPDKGTTYRYTGSGTTTLGATSLTGSRTSPGYVMSASCDGRLQLATAQGSLTISLRSAPVPGFSACPRESAWTINSASGHYRDDRGSGSVVISQAHGAFTMRFSGRVEQKPKARKHLADTGGNANTVLVALALGGLGLVVRRFAASH